MTPKRLVVPMIVGCLALCSFSPLVAQDIEERVVEHTLENGMKLLLMRRAQSPTVALDIWVKAGGVDEPVNKTGIAHMLEHMLFKGTTTIGTTDYAAEVPLMEQLDELYEEHDALRDAGDDGDAARLEAVTAEIEAVKEEQKQHIVSNQISELYSYHGETGLNAGTGRDMTMYTIQLPSNKIELWMRVEAERMRDPVFREFYTERDVVMSERRQVIESSPGRLLNESFYAAAFVAHPYGRPIIGWMSDLNRLRRKEAEAFFRTYYAPNNSIVSMVGDIDIEWAIERMTHYFSDIPRQQIPERVGTREPEQRGERRVTVEFDAEPQLRIGYHKPTLPSRDDFVFDMIDGVLTDGRTSRLYRALVEEQQIAVSVSSGNGAPGGRYDNLFVVSATPRHPHTPEEVEAAIYAELERLKVEPPTERELQKVRNQNQAAFIRGLDSNSGMSSQLGYFELIAGSWRYVLTAMETMNSITAEDVQAAATKYLIPQNRTVATLVKPAAEEAAE
jgi:predicted Zn-dependent peptidase